MENRGRDQHAHLSNGRSHGCPQCGARGHAADVKNNARLVAIPGSDEANARALAVVTARVCGLFAAYHGFYPARVAKPAILMIGNREMVERMWQASGELAVVRAAAPADVVQRFAERPKFLAYIEVELLAELQRTLAGEVCVPNGLASAMRGFVRAQDNQRRE